MSVYIVDFSKEPLTPLTAISPLDGRYWGRVNRLSNRFSEAAWMRARVHVEAEYLVASSDEGVIRQLSGQERGFMENLYKNFSLTDAVEVKKIERGRARRHDIKAIEYWMGDKFRGTSMADLVPKIHLGLTSEDVDNIAIHYLLKQGVMEDYLPTVVNVIEDLRGIVTDNKAVAILGRTHGKRADTTSLGKEMAFFLERVGTAASGVAYRADGLGGKVSGPVGTYNPLKTTYPTHDWIRFAGNFVRRFGLNPKYVTTQIGSHDDVARLFRDVAGVNDVMEDLSQNLWLYSTLDLIYLTAGDRGISSIMAHKRNPEEFENAEGNLQTSSALLNFMASKLTKSRLQRDLSGSTVRRNYGVALGHAVLANQNISEGLKLVNVDRDAAIADIRAHPEILGTNMQTILRAAGKEGAYESLQEMTRGKTVTEQQMAQWAAELEIDDETRMRLASLDVMDFGEAERVADMALNSSRTALNRIKKKIKDAA
ncbi:MAG: adenylosuccinate lyase [Candidatus Aenigmarchaeota archaeon]|nr:adenylosuccinate lyase [Candidatus Aenigmarchaeota archaeon]